MMKGCAGINPVHPRDFENTRTETCSQGFSLRLGMSLYLQPLAEMCWEGRSCTCLASSPTVSDCPSLPARGLALGESGLGAARQTELTPSSTPTSPWAHPEATVRHKPPQLLARLSDLCTYCWGQRCGGHSVGAPSCSHGTLLWVFTVVEGFGGFRWYRLVVGGFCVFWRLQNTFILLQNSPGITCPLPCSFVL